jgi:ribosomal protein L29
MKDAEKREFLKQLQAEYMIEKTRLARNFNDVKTKLLRREIAYMKTVLHEQGYHYHPREGT